MEVEAKFACGAKALLIALLNAVKDFNKPNSLSLRITGTGISARFACGPPSHPLRAIISFILDYPSPTLNIGANAAAPQSEQKGGSVANAGPNITSDTATPTTVTPGTVFASLVCKSELMVITVHPRTLCHQLELVDENDRITIRAEKQSDGAVPIYELYFESPDLGRKVLYEMDTVPRVEPIPPLTGISKYAFIVQIEGEEFRRTVAALHETSEKVLITGTKNSITFCATGTIGTLQVGLVQKPNATDKVPRFKVLSFVAPIRQTFDTRFLRGFTSATPLSTYVTLSFPPAPANAPLKITFPIETDAAADGSFRLASASGGSTLPIPSAPITSVVSNSSGSAPGSPVREGASSTSDNEAGSPVGSPVKKPVGADVAGRKVVGRLEYYIHQERE